MFFFSIIYNKIYIGGVEVNKNKSRGEISKEMGKERKGIHFIVIFMIVAIFGAGTYLAIYKLSSGKDNMVVQQDYLASTDTTSDSDGDGYIDSEDSNPDKWNVGERDLLMFATLAYEPAKGKYYLDNGGEGDKKNWSDTKTEIDYVCPDTDSNGKIIKSNPAVDKGKYSIEKSCMIDEQKMVGMKAEDNQMLGNLVFYRWQTVGNDYYFAGMDQNGDAEYYAKVDEVNKWAIVDYTSKPTVKAFKTGGNFEATTFRYDNNFVIAYRGTDFADLIEWMADVIGYGVLDTLGNYEKEAENYAKTIIEKYTKEYENAKTGEKPNFYITGHSLGGYLAQVGAAYVVNDANNVIGRENLRDVIYFNGMGIGFNDGLKLSLDKSVLLGSWDEAVASKNEKYQQLLKWSKGENDSTPGLHKVICYHNYGDPISALGIHVQKQGFYVAPGAIRRHMDDKSVSQLLTRNNLVKKVTVSLLNGANRIFQVSNLSEVAKYYDYYNKQYRKPLKALSVADLMWFAHEPSASLFYNINQGVRGAKKQIEVSTSASYAANKKTATYTFNANVNGNVKSYRWYINNIPIIGATGEQYVVKEIIGNIIPKNKYSVKAIVKTINSDGKVVEKTIESVANVDRIPPKITVSTNGEWMVKRSKNITINVKATDVSGFSDNTISTSDIKFTGLAKNLKVVSVSSPVSSDGGKTQEWKVVLKGNIAGFTRMIITTGAIRDSYGNPNPEFKTISIKVPLV